MLSNEPWKRKVAAQRAEIARRYRAGKRARPQQTNLGVLQLAQLQRMFCHRYGYELPDNEHGRSAARVVAHYLAHRPGDVRRHIAAWAELNCPWMGKLELMKMTEFTLAKPRRFKADTLAKHFGVTAAERKRLGLTVIGAIDMPKDERLRQRREKRRARELQRRQAKGGKPRAQYEAESISRAKKWNKLGISRATWYRRGKPNP
jgi:hypothetical protein